MKVSSRDLYRELRSALAPVMKGAGFRPLKGSQLGWTRTGDSGTLIVWFQVNKWGWNERWGSTFTVEFQMAPPGALPMSGHGRRQRLGYLLEGFPELDELRLRNNAVIAMLPGTLAGQVVMATLPDGKPFVKEGFLADPAPAVYGRDIWLNYQSLEDARWWGGYFAAKMLRFVSLFENETLSAQGQASARFHAAMGSVQRAKSIEEKAAILEEYLRTETDAHYQAGARQWLSHLPIKK